MNIKKLGRTLYNKEDYEKLDKLATNLGLECCFKNKDDIKIDNIIEQIIEIYQK